MKTTFILYENYQTHFAGLYSIVGSFVLHLHVTDSTIQIQHLDHMVTTTLKGEVNRLGGAFPCQHLVPTVFAE